MFFNDLGPICLFIEAYWSAADSLRYISFELFFANLNQWFESRIYRTVSISFDQLVNSESLISSLLWVVARFLRFTISEVGLNNFCDLLSLKIVYPSFLRKFFSNYHPFFSMLQQVILRIEYSFRFLCLDFLFQYLERENTPCFVI